MILKNLLSKLGSPDVWIIKLPDSVLVNESIFPSTSTYVLNVKSFGKVFIAKEDVNSFEVKQEQITF